MENDNSLTGLKKYLFIFDKYTSRNGQDWLLALTWIFIFEIISTILEYEYLDIAQNYVYHLPDGIFKESIIALFLVFFVWYIVYSLIYMKRHQFFFLGIYTILVGYLLITHDITFNLLVHNLINPFEFEFEFNSFSFYILLQLFIKIIITYLLFKLYISVKNRKKNTDI